VRTRWTKLPHLVDDVDVDTHARHDLHNLVVTMLSSLVKGCRTVLQQQEQATQQRVSINECLQFILHAAHTPQGQGKSRFYLGRNFDVSTRSHQDLHNVVVTLVDSLMEWS
jgi:hypothetical protein